MPTEKRVQMGRFLVAWSHAYVENEQWRLGQAAFNALDGVFPGMANEIAGFTSIDPFHDDMRLGAFLGAVQELMAQE